MREIYGNFDFWQIFQVFKRFFGFYQFFRVFLVCLGIFGFFRVFRFFRFFTSFSNHLSYLYNSAEEQCCNGHLYDSFFEHSEECCGVAVFSRETHLCCKSLTGDPDIKTIAEGCGFGSLEFGSQIKFNRPPEKIKVESNKAGPPKQEKIEKLSRLSFLNEVDGEEVSQGDHESLRQLF